MTSRSSPCSVFRHFWVSLLGVSYCTLPILCLSEPGTHRYYSQISLCPHFREHRGMILASLLYSAYRRCEYRSRKRSGSFFINMGTRDKSVIAARKWWLYRYLLLYRYDAQWKRRYLRDDMLHVRWSTDSDALHRKIFPLSRYIWHSNVSMPIPLWRLMEWQRRISLSRPSRRRKLNNEARNAFPSPLEAVD